MNYIALMGNITKEHELRTTASQKAVLSFTIAVQRKFKNADGEKQTDFINCVSWGKTAEIMAKYTNKGDKIVVTGELQTRTYENKEGQKVYASEVIVNEFHFTGKAGEKPTNTLAEDKTDLPFDL